MSFLCRIAEPYRPLVAAERRSGSGLYHVDGHGDVIRKLWEVAKDRKGRGALESPFLEPHTEEALHFVEPQGLRRDHFRRPGDTTSPVAARGTLDAHQWVQWQLAELGASWRMTVQLEDVVGGGRCDVTWRERRIAWEVDLSAKSATDRRLRNERRAAAGWTVISVVDSKLCRRNLEEPAVHLYALRRCARKAVAGKRGFFEDLGKIYTQRLYGLEGVGAGEMGWLKVPSFEFRQFASELLDGCWVYSDFSGIRAEWGSGWAIAEDLERARESDRELQMRARQWSERWAEIEQEHGAKERAWEDVKRQLQSIWAGAPVLMGPVESGGWIRRAFQRHRSRKAQARIEEDHARRRVAAEPLEREKQQIETHLGRLSGERAELLREKAPAPCLPEAIWSSVELRAVALPCSRADRPAFRTPG